MHVARCKQCKNAKLQRYEFGKATHGREMGIPVRIRGGSESEDEDVQVEDVPMDEDSDKDEAAPVNERLHHAVAAEPPALQPPKPGKYIYIVLMQFPIITLYSTLFIFIHY